MTRKQMKKLAKEIYDCELIHSDSSSSTEERSRAESRVIQITNSVMALKDGIDILLEIDNIVQQLVTKNMNKGDN